MIHTFEKIGKLAKPIEDYNKAHEEFRKKALQASQDDDDRASYARTYY